MSIPSYGVLKASVIGARREDSQDTPHYQIHALAAGEQGQEHFRVAVNVESQQSPSDLLFLVREPFESPLLTRLDGLAPGFHPLERAPGGLALDFVRADLLSRTDMTALPPSQPGPDNDLADRIEALVSRAQREAGATLYAFGSAWGPERGQPDKIFGFEPGRGVHNVHMNQGNSGRFQRDDGVWQDGALLLHFPVEETWAAVFLAFQSQSWDTDNRSGHALDG